MAQNHSHGCFFVRAMSPFIGCNDVSDVRAKPDQPGGELLPQAGEMEEAFIMQYVIVFLEGIITFLSPCLLPMLPIYISYFAGGEEQNSARTVRNALGFVLGFTLVFVTMGALAGTVGSFLKSHQRELNLVSGAVVILFGLNFLGFLKLRLFQGNGFQLNSGKLGFFSSLLFGVIFSVGWTPCVGAFLGSALVLASQRGHALEGVLMLLLYSLGLGIPFLISAVLIDSLKGALSWVKRHYAAVNAVSGGFLILVGVLMASGLMGRMLALFAA